MLEGSNLITDYLYNINKKIEYLCKIFEFKKEKEFLFRYGINDNEIILILEYGIKQHQLKPIFSKKYKLNDSDKYIDFLNEIRNFLRENYNYKIEY